MLLAAEAAHLLRDPTQFEPFSMRLGIDPLVAGLIRHGIAPYVAWQRPDISALTQVRRNAILEDALQHGELDRLSKAFEMAGVPLLVLKGAAWARTVYPAPWCRPRADVDLLTLPVDRDRAREVMLAAGYTLEPRLSGALASFQDAFSRVVAGGYRCAVDLHWEVANRLAVVTRLPSHELFARSCLFDAGGLGVRQLSPVDSVLVAAIHPVAHHPDEVEVKWWLDLVHLVQTLTTEEVVDLERRATGSGVAGILAHALTEARQCAGPEAAGAAALQEAFISRLRVRASSESTTAFLQAGRGRLDDLASDLEALSTWRARVRLLREHLFPPATFIRGTSERVGWGWLPWLYVRRGVTGGARWAGAWLRERVNRLRG